MQLIEVTTPAHRKEFLELPVRIYRNEPNWIRPLDQDIEKVFDPAKNPFFKHGECIRWLLQDSSGKVIGRVAAFIDRESTVKTWTLPDGTIRKDQPTGGMGFFECINDQKAAFTLFDACKQWLEARGMEAMDGPINFGERDQWWGLLVDGFLPPNYGMFYHMPYYKELFEAYGFQVFFNQYTYYRTVKAPLHPAVFARADRVRSNPDYTFDHIKKNNLEKYTEDFRVIFNRSWGEIKAGEGEMSYEQSRSIMKQLKPIIDEKLIWFGYYKGEPIGFFVMLPEMNQIFRHMNGKFDLLAKIKFLWHQWRGTSRKMFGVVFGVVPEHQGKAVDAAIVMAARDLIQDHYDRYDDLEMNWIGDFNPPMMKVVELMGGKIIKVHATYRKLFDESKPFERHPILKKGPAKTNPS
ncbi:hypothetical protein QNI19_22885 [Cytophagaceae bacterium DM2B3-1]|uniref:N-acetyltransferase n=1 Tax=Xanthocytophaga flava TaxID=3048013 RepID=A0ABT7CS51_9BACT|nr:hypothetical protein [Xanthocytophaga flavus]MDJ1495800.1 hypothetical protein [Xanthocytophaga flavus]